MGVTEKTGLVRKDHTVYEVLTRYPELKRVLLELSPKFKRLDNPLAFQTLARVTTLEKAAKIGGVYLREMLYRLNDALGWGKEYLETEKASIQAFLRAGEGLQKVASLVEKRTGGVPPAGPSPPWLQKATHFPLLDLRTLPEDPFDRVTRMSAGLKPGEGLILIQSFEPLPLLSHLARQGFLHYVEQRGSKEYWIYLIKER